MKPWYTPPVVIPIMVVLMDGIYATFLAPGEPFITVSRGADQNRKITCRFKDLKLVPHQEFVRLRNGEPKCTAIFGQQSTRPLCWRWSQ
jgi:hypothetical protein